MRSVPSPVAAPRSPSDAAGRSRPTFSSLNPTRRSRQPADTRSAADRSAERTRAAGPTRPANAPRPAGAPRPSRRTGTASTRPSTPLRATTGSVRPAGAAAPADDALRDRSLLVAAAAAVCAVLALALLSGVPAGAAVAIGFVPSLAGGWLFLTLVPGPDGLPSPTATRAGGALLAAHVVALLPVAAAILLAG